MPTPLPARGLPDQSALLEELPAEIQGDVLTVYHTLVRHRPSAPAGPSASLQASTLPRSPRDIEPHEGQREGQREETQRDNTAPAPAGPDVLESTQTA